MSRLHAAVALDKTLVDAWMDLIGVENSAHRTQEAGALIDRALAANPDSSKLLEARAVILRRAQQLRAAEAYLIELLPRFETAAWLHFQLAATIADYDRDRANVHFRRAVELEPESLDYLIPLIESLERTRSGDEGANIEESYQLALKALAFKPTHPGHLKVLYEVLIRVCAFDLMPQLGDFAALGRAWARSNRHTALLKQLAQVKTLDDRYELLEQHRIWARQTEAEAAKQPLRRSPPRPSDGKIRLGFMSSDLRAHPVGYFALPLFDHADPRFEIYCYSFFQGEKADAMQAPSSKSTAYRWNGYHLRNAAQQTRTTESMRSSWQRPMTRLTMATGRAKQEAGWAIRTQAALDDDYLIADPTAPRAAPRSRPRRCLSAGSRQAMAFSDVRVITPGLPEERPGHHLHLANNPHITTPEMPRSGRGCCDARPRFIFIRPEGAQHLQANRRRSRARRCRPSGSVSSTIRSARMPFYNETTSAGIFPDGRHHDDRSLRWACRVSHSRRAFFSGWRVDPATGLRPSTGTGLSTCAGRRSPPTGARARQTLREQIGSSPLGQTEQFIGLLRPDRAHGAAGS